MTDELKKITHKDIWNKLLEMQKTLDMDYTMKRSDIQLAGSQNAQKTKKHKAKRTIFKEKFSNAMIPKKPRSPYLIFSNMNKEQIIKSMKEKSKDVRKEYSGTELKESANKKSVSWTKRELDENGKWTKKFEKNKKGKIMYWKLANETGYQWKKLKPKQKEKYNKIRTEEELPEYYSKWAKFEKEQNKMYKIFISDEYGGVDPRKEIKKKVTLKKKKTDITKRKTGGSVSVDALYADKEEDFVDSSDEDN